VGLVRARRGDEAIRALETAIAIDREFAPAYALLGRLRLGQAPAAYVAVLAPDASSRIRLVLLRPGSGPDTTGRILRRAFMLDPLQEIEPVDINTFPSSGAALCRGPAAVPPGTGRPRRGAVRQRHRGLRPSQQAPSPVALWYHALAASASGRFRGPLDVRRGSTERSVIDAGSGVAVQPPVRARCAASAIGDHAEAGVSSGR
jgi:hypothetical protein